MAWVGFGIILLLGLSLAAGSWYAVYYFISALASGNPEAANQALMVFGFFSFGAWTCGLTYFLVWSYNEIVG